MFPDSDLKADWFAFAPTSALVMTAYFNDDIHPVNGLQYYDGSTLMPLPSKVNLQSPAASLHGNQPVWFREAEYHALVS